MTSVFRVPLLFIIKKYLIIKYKGSISVSGQLRTYPSPNPTVTLAY